MDLSALIFRDEEEMDSGYQDVVQLELQLSKKLSEDIDETLEFD